MRNIIRNLNRSSPGSAGNRQKKLIPLILVFVLVLLSIPFSPFEKSTPTGEIGDTSPGFMEVLAATTTNPALNVSATYNSSDSRINTTVYVSKVDATYPAEEVGFVYSSSHSAPDISNSTRVTLRNNVTEPGNFSGSFTAPVSSGTVYVRAFAKDKNNKYHYSVTQYVTVNSYTGDVSINRINNIGYYSADVEIRTSGSYNNSGVVYSRYGTPSVGSREGIAYSGNYSGYQYVHLNNLYANTRYYVRAFITLGDGRYVYSSERSFYTDGSSGSSSNNYGGSSSIINYNKIPDDGTSNNAFISTSNVTDVTETSATARGEVGYNYSSSDAYYYNRYYYDGYYSNDYYYNNGNYYRYNDGYYRDGQYYRDGYYYSDDYYYSDGSYYNRGYYNYERGFVYSTTAIAPTVSDSKVYETNSSGGPYTYNITGLTPNTKYYVRAYVRNAYGTFYGAALNFTTKPSISSEATSSSSSSSSSASGSSAYASASTATYSSQKPFMEQIASRTFGPDNMITRGEIAKIIYALKSGAPVVGGSKDFVDVPVGYEAKTEIDFAVSRGYMQGYPDYTFKPDNLITRAEISTVLCVVFDITPDNSDGRFSDTAYHWAAPYITAAANAGIISGYPNNIFKPDENTTRAESCVLFARGSNRTIEPLGATTFYDVPSTHWAYRYIMNAALAR